MVRSEQSDLVDPRQPLAQERRIVPRPVSIAAGYDATWLEKWHHTQIDEGNLKRKGTKKLTS